MDFITRKFICAIFVLCLILIQCSAEESSSSNDNPLDDHTVNGLHTVNITKGNNSLLVSQEMQFPKNDLFNSLMTLRSVIEDNTLINNEGKKSNDGSETEEKGESDEMSKLTLRSVRSIDNIQNEKKDKNMNENDEKMMKYDNKGDDAEDKKDLGRKLYRIIRSIFGDNENESDETNEDDVSDDSDDDDDENENSDGLFPSVRQMRSLIKKDKKLDGSMKANDDVVVMKKNEGQPVKINREIRSIVDDKNKEKNQMEKNNDDELKSSEMKLLPLIRMMRSAVKDDNHVKNSTTKNEHMKNDETKDDQLKGDETKNETFESFMPLARMRRSITDIAQNDGKVKNNDGLESVVEVNEEKVFDLEFAESSVVFKPLFRYRSQVGQKKRVYRKNNDYENNY